MHDSAAPSSVEVDTPEQIAYTVRRAAQLLDLSERKVQQLVAEEKIESIKVGRARRIPRQALVAYIEGLRSAA